MMSSKKKLVYGLLIVGLLVVLYVTHDVHPPAPPLSLRVPQSAEPADVSKTEKFSTDTDTTSFARDKRKAFLRELDLESRNMAKIDENSKETEDRLKKRGEGLSAAEIETLREMSLNKNVSSDERFLAVYLLGYNSSAASQKALWVVAQEPVEKNLKPDSVLYHQELVLRAQALLGLNRQLPEAERKSQLSSYANNQRELFLSRLAYRLTREPASKASLGP